MFAQGLWLEPYFQKIAFRIIAILLLMGLVIYFQKKRDMRWMAAWISVKSWIFVAPIILIIAGMPAPFPFIALAIASIFGIKTFYQMSALYHSRSFAGLGFVFTVILAWTAYNDLYWLYNLVPMIFLGALTLCPIFKNNSENMIQYISLSLIGFLLAGWSFMHLSFILKAPSGVYTLLYFYALAEINFNVSRLIFKLQKKSKKIFSNISLRLSYAGALTSLVCTLFLGHALRGCLPERELWLPLCLALWFFGHWGDLFLGVIRKDLNITDHGIFIIGRDDVLNRMSKLLIFSPFVYHYFIYLGLL